MVKTEPVDNSEKDDIIDVRGKYIQLPNGKMNGSLPSARVKMTKAGYTAMRTGTTFTL